MSFSLGLYDVFANIVPGLLYFYVFNEGLRLLGWQSIDLTKVNTIGQALIVIVVSFVLGNIIGSLTFRYWYKLFYRRHFAEATLERLRRRHPDLKFEFKPDDGEIIFVVIKHHNKLLAEKIETTRVNSIMMRNVSFGIFLYSLLSIFLFFSQRDVLYLGASVITVIFSGLSLRRAAVMDRWFFQDVFREALNYGNNVKQVLITSKRITSNNSTKDKFSS